jgi:hypothetical protein
LEFIILFLNPAGVVLFTLSAARLPGVTATALEISYLDQAILDKKSYLFGAGHIDVKV